MLKKEHCGNHVSPACLADGEITLGLQKGLRSLSKMTEGSWSSWVLCWTIELGENWTIFWHFCLTGLEVWCADHELQPPSSQGPAVSYSPPSLWSDMTFLSLALLVIGYKPKYWTKVKGSPNNFLWQPWWQFLRYFTEIIKYYTNFCSNYHNICPDRWKSWSASGHKLNQGNRFGRHTSDIC